MRILVSLAAFLLAAAGLRATDAVFPATEAGRVELKTVPAGVLLKAAGKGDYFEQDTSLFLRLFRFISDRDVSMTTPVVAQVDDAALFFWVAGPDREKASRPPEGVVVVNQPAREVASAGAKGSYSRENYLKTRKVLQAWLAQQAEFEPVGEPYAVFWNGPFTPWFAKRYEVHQPVRRKVAEPNRRS
jgi:hypothetical protein